MADHVGTLCKKALKFTIVEEKGVALRWLQHWCFQGRSKFDRDEPLGHKMVDPNDCELLPRSTLERTIAWAASQQIWLIDLDNEELP